MRDPGEYAVRGGIIDLFAPGMELGVRLDFFGDSLDSIRSFDPQTQRSSGQLRTLELVPVSEFQLPVTRLGLVCSRPKAPGQETATVFVVVRLIARKGSGVMFPSRMRSFAVSAT